MLMVRTMPMGKKRVLGPTSHVNQRPSPSSRAYVSNL